MGDRPDDQDRPGRPIPVRDIDPAGRARGVDDHRISPVPRGIGHQPTGDLDPAVDDEHLSSSSQGMKVEEEADRPASDAERSPV